MLGRSPRRSAADSLDVGQRPDDNDAAAGRSNTVVLALAILGAGVGVAASSTPLFRSSPVSVLLAADIFLVAVGGATTMALTRGPRSPWSGRLPWIVCGALLGAACLGVAAMGIWVFLAALLFAAAGGAGRPVRRRGSLVRLAALVACAALGNLLLLAALTGGRHRLPPEEFRSAEFRVHKLLSDVPLHDVWRAHLRGGGRRATIPGLQALLDESSWRDAVPIVIGLAALRSGLGHLLGWDDEDRDDPAASYVHRLTGADRSRSVDEPGSRVGSWRIIYRFEREALFELINGTVHAFVALAIEPHGENDRLYLAVYVKPVNRLTPVYMAFIDPFRRLLVYPTVIRHVEHAWATR
jgi:hypothetical protein